MSKEYHYVILSGNKHKVEEMIEMAQDFDQSGAGSFTRYEVLNQNTLILAYPKKRPPKLEDLRKFLFQQKGIVVSYFMSDEVVVMEEGHTKSIVP